MSAWMMRGLAAALLASLPFAALAGGALSICGPAAQPSSSNVAVKYPTNSVTLTLDQGTLGPLSNTQARTLVTNAVALWTNVGTATINIGISSGSLTTDVTGANLASTNYYNNGSDGISPVIYDTDGSVIDSLFGVGASDQILGFAGSGGIGFPTCAYTEGQAVMSG